MSLRTLTITAVYREGCHLLTEAGISEASLDAWCLLEHVSGIHRAAYYGNPKRILSEDIAEKFFRNIQKRRERIPLQHLTGVQGFMGLEFMVNKHVLIPRQDTETLVEAALEKLADGMRVLDLCTGSGCILLSLLKLQHVGKIFGIGADISPAALSVAKENARKLKVNASFLQGDLFEGISSHPMPYSAPFDIIVSNPPYIATADIEYLQEEVRSHDPLIALDGGEDGLYFYRRITKESAAYIKPGGWLLLEIGFDQGAAVSEMMRETGYAQVSVKKDLAGLDRVVCGMYNKKQRLE